MADVIAITRGYFGGEVREPGERFPWPDGRDLASWVRPAGSVEFSPEAVDAPEAVKAKHRGRGKGKPKAETVEAPEADPFADEPQTVADATKAIGSVQPDWVQSPQPVAD